jgi:DNA-binding transcriptional LysR family regulator
MALPSRVVDLTGFDLLLSVARTGSLGRAAAEHGISQPAASARMRLLEGHLGFALIERSPRGSRLTAPGALVAGWAQTAVDAAAALDASIIALRQEQHSRLRVAASMTVAEYLFPGWLGALRAADPDAAVALSAVNSAEVGHAVLAGTADIGFVEGPGIPAGLHAEPVGRDRLTLVVAPAHPWARRRSGVPISEVGATSLVTREAGSGTRRFLEEALIRAGAALAPPLAELSSTTAIKAAVAAGAGPAVLSSLAVAGDIAGGTLCAVPVTGIDLNRTLMAVWPAGRPLTGPARDLYTVAARSVRRSP